MGPSGNDGRTLGFTTNSSSDGMLEDDMGPSQNQGIRIAWGHNYFQRGMVNKIAGRARARWQGKHFVQKVFDSTLRFPNERPRNRQQNIEEARL